MVKRSAPDEIDLDEIMKASMKEMGKGEAVTEPITEQPLLKHPLLNHRNHNLDSNLEK